MPGDIFVLRNAGNTCTHAEGLVGDFWTAGLRLWFRVLGSGFRVLGLGFRVLESEEVMCWSDSFCR